MTNKKLDPGTEIVKKENKKVLQFIKNWQKNNLYNSEKLKQYNKDFKRDFKQFLANENFSEYTTTFFS